MNGNTQALTLGEDGMKQLLEAAISGDTTKLPVSVLGSPEILLSKTAPEGSTCLHISAAFGHEQFSKAVVGLNPSLLTSANSYGETALIVAITSGQVAVASTLLTLCKDNNETAAILADDKDGNNALHHAICNGHTNIALELLIEEPALSEKVNIYGDSPMFIAVMRGFTEILEKLLEISSSSAEGGCGNNVLHAAARTGDQEITKMIMAKNEDLAQKENNFGNTPLREAVIRNQIEVVRVLLEHDRSLGYHISEKDGFPPLFSAAHNGHVGVAKELLDHCPDAPYRATKHLRDSNPNLASQPPGDRQHPCRSPAGMTCLHNAVIQGHVEFVEFILTSPTLHKLINVQDSNGNTALHYAIQKQDPKIVRALLAHKGINVRVRDRWYDGSPFSSLNISNKDSAKTLKWNEVFTLMSEADPQAASKAYRKRAEREITADAMKKVKELTKSYTESTSVVAILITTVTFAAAFTLPGGYSDNTGNTGLPVLARKVAFKLFLISDTLAMCSSLAVAFICINISRREDYEFLLHYVSFSKMLMWFSYVTTTVAFATGLYTVLAPRILWLAISVCAVSFVFPILALLLGQWPILKVKFRLGRAFKPDILDMV